jgi:hypothetical protein
MSKNPHPLTSSNKQKLAYNLLPLLDCFARPSLTSLLWLNLHQTSPKVAFKDIQMALPMEIDPVNAVLGLLGFLIGVTLLGMKMHKNCGPRGRRSRRHHNRRRTGDILPIHEPPRPDRGQYEQSSQHGQQRGANSQLSSR